MERHVWRWAAAASVGGGAAFVLLDDVMLREAVWLALVTGTCGAMVLGARLHRPRHIHPFSFLLSAFVLLALSYVLVYPAWDTAVTELLSGVALLIAYPLICGAVLSLVRLQAPGGDREGAIDGAIVMIAMATLLAGTVFDPSSVASDELLPRILIVVAPLLLSGVTAATFRLLFVGTVRVPSAWFLIGAAAGGLVGTVARTVATTQGTYQRGTWVDLFVLSSYVFVALACLHPSVAQLTQPSAPGSRRLTFARLAVLGAALLAAPATLVIQQPGLGISMPIVSSVVLSLLVLWRLARLVVEREAVRRALHDRATRQEALADIGRHALDDPELAALYDEVVRCCRDLLELDVCAVLGPDDPDPVPDGVVAIEIDRHAGTVVAGRDAAWSDEDLAFLHAAANVLTGAYRRHQDQQTMHHRAVHDALTGLPNRVLIVDRIEQALARARRSGETVSVLFLDLDDFKQTNDIYGHQAGDEVLVTVAARITSQVREVDTVGRLAGDEFVVVCDPADAATACEVGRRIVTAMSEPFELECGSVRVGVSIGVATSATARDAERLLGEADLAMYSAKDQLGSAVVAFDQGVGDARERRRGLEIDLAAAIEARAMRLVYQPLVTMGAGGEADVIGVEALLRWDHPEHGPVPPLEFIPVAEATGLILPLGDWVIEEAIRQLARWCEGLADDVPFAVWVNLSPRQLVDPHLPDRVAGILSAAGVPAWRFGCEVTESAIMSEDTGPIVAAMRGMGIKFALDDFGTGFSSLTHLRQLTMDLVKIDRSFVAGVAESGGDRAIVRAVTSLAAELGLEVVGEGVETNAQLAALHDLGCDLVQGYLLGRPVDPEDITAPGVTGRRQPSSSSSSSTAS